MSVFKKPLQAIALPIHGSAINDADGFRVVTDIYDYKVVRQIVRESNSHDLLLEALRGLRRDKKCWCMTWVGGEHEPECAAAIAALAIAEGTTNESEKQDET